MALSEKELNELRNEVERKRVKATFQPDPILPTVKPNYPTLRGPEEQTFTPRDFVETARAEGFDAIAGGGRALVREPSTGATSTN